MLKKLMSAVLLSTLTLSAFAAPDAIEADLAASIARAVKAEDEAKDVLRAAHVRALKSRISANEVAMRRLKSKLAVTKDADAKVAIEARVAELTDEVTAMTAETQTTTEVTICAVEAPVPVKEAVTSPVEKFSNVSGVWLSDAGENGSTEIVVISTKGEILTCNGLSLAITGDRRVFALTSGGEIVKEKVVRLSLTKMRYVGQGGSAHTWTRLTAAVPPAELRARSAGDRTPCGVGLNTAGAEALRAFVKANPIKR